MADTNEVSGVEIEGLKARVKKLESILGFMAHHPGFRVEGSLYKDFLPPDLQATMQETLKHCGEHEGRLTRE